MIIGELKTLWGVVNAAHPDFSDVAAAVEWAQREGYKEVYIPPGEYLLDDKTILIQTSDFTLRGAGMGNTILKVSSTYNLAQESGVVVQPLQEITRITGVRLVDFAVKKTDEGGAYPLTRQGGVYLKDCFRALVERIQVETSDDTGPFDYGFKAMSFLTGNQPPAGGILFSQCCVIGCLKGLWLTANNGALPMQRCSLINPYFDATAVTEGVATGGDNQSLIDRYKDFLAANVSEGDWVFNKTAGTYGQIESISYSPPGEMPNNTLNLASQWQGGGREICQNGDAYGVVTQQSYGVYIHKAKGTLVEGGLITHYEYGVYIEPNMGDDNQLSQMIVPKFDLVSYGVYIGTNANQTQVIAVSRSQQANNVVDDGLSSLVVGLQVQGETPTGGGTLWLHQGKCRFPSDVDVYGLLDAAKLDEAGAGLRTYSPPSGDLTQNALNAAFDTQSPGFIGIYTNQSGQRFIVARFNVAINDDDWYYGGPLTRPPGP